MLAEPDDGRALAATSPRDLDAFCAELSDRLVGVLTLRVGDRLVAEELAQEALAKAWLRWDEVSIMANPAGWVYRVAFNLAASRFRRRAAERRAVARLAAFGDPGPTLEIGEAVAVRSALQTLSRRQQEVVVLRYFADLSVSDTAETLGVTTGTVKTLTHRALRSLSGVLGPELSEGDDA